MSVRRLIGTVGLVALLALGVGCGRLRKPREPRDAQGFVLRGFQSQQNGQYDRAIADFDRALALDPNNVRALTGRGEARGRKGEHDRAIADFDRALTLDPAFLPALHGRGAVHEKTGDHDAAIRDYDEILRHDGADTSALTGRAIAWNAKGEFGQAQADYDAAIAANPEHALALNNRGWLRATCPDAGLRDGIKAVQDARQACELTHWADPIHLDTLAAAYAETGQYAEAVRWQAKALDDPRFATEHGDEARERLRLYESAKPYREGIP